MKITVISLILSLLIFFGCNNLTNNDNNSKNSSDTNSIDTSSNTDSITVIGITIKSTNNTLLDEINIARTAMALGGEVSKKYYTDIIVPNVMNNSDKDDRLSELKNIFYGKSSLNSSISQDDMRELKNIVEDRLITADIDNYTKSNHDISSWKQGENAEIAWFSDLSKYSVTADYRARAAVAGWLLDSGNSPNFGHRVAILNPAYKTGGATSDVTNSMNSEPNIKSGGHVIARFKL